MSMTRLLVAGMGDWWAMRTQILTSFTLVWLLAGCGDQPAAVVTLEQVAERPAAFDGRRVVLSGTLRRHDDPRHYWIEDAALHRVAVRFDGKVDAYVGGHVEVRGRFRFDPATGRRVEADALIGTAPADRSSDRGAPP